MDGFTPLPDFSCFIDADSRESNLFAHVYICTEFETVFRGILFWRFRLYHH